MRPALDAFFYSDRWRSFQWLVLSGLLLHIALDFDLQEKAPAWQATLYYVGSICLRANLGYWIARTVLGRLDEDINKQSIPQAIILAAKYVARAMLISAVVLTAK